MSIKRISTRISSVEKICVACLPEHRLVFHKRSNDGSAKCDAFHSSNKQDQVYGVIYRISAEQKIILDKYEGLGQGYADKTVSLTDSEGREYQAITYYALDISHSLQPYHWYKEHVLSGAKEHALPEYYINKIAQVESVDDQHPTRPADELKIYR